MPVISENEAKQLVSQITEIPVEKLGLDLDLFKDLGVDSLKAIEIVAAFEKKYRIIIPEKEMPNIRKIRQMIDYLKSAKKA